MKAIYGKVYQIYAGFRYLIQQVFKKRKFPFNKVIVVACNLFFFKKKDISNIILYFTIL